MSSRNAGIGGFPGFDYIERIGQAWLAAAASHTQVLNQSWEQMRQGTYDYRTFLQNVTLGAENYFNTMVEVSRGPGYIYEPVWVCFDYQRVGDVDVPESLDATVKIGRTEATSTQIESTPFAALG